MSAATLAEADMHTGARPGRAWLPVAAVMLFIGWGGNQFTPLLPAYRERLGYTAVDVDVFLGAYVLGLLPGLLLASALSDRYGRKPLLLLGGAASPAGSAALAVGAGGQPVALMAGRLLSGLAVGVAMSVGTAWVTELSPGRPGAGARRASTCLTLGLGVGPGVAGVLTEWGPLPLQLPYLVQIVLVLPALILLLVTGREPPRATGRARLRVPAAAHRRFRWVVLPMAPWIFGSAGVAYAIVPQVVGGGLLFTTALTVTTLGTGVAVQPIARRLDSVSTARAVFVSMILMTLGVVAAAITAATRSTWWAVPTALLLGAAYGIAVVSGLLEVQRIARPDDLAGLTGVYYALAYLGFLLPAALAAASHHFGYPAMLAVLAVVAAGCTAIIGSAWSRHLPA
jgi:predicted MFS family arabinose efflux permease